MMAETFFNGEVRRIVDGEQGSNIVTVNIHAKEKQGVTLRFHRDDGFLRELHYGQRVKVILELEEDS